MRTRFVAPAIFFLNLYYCLTTIPSAFERRFARGSLVVFTGLTAIIILANVFDVTLFGG